MLTLSAGAIAHKNSLSDDSCWLALLEVQIPGTTLYLANNNENITWNGQVWQAFPFDVDPLRENSGTEIPIATIRVSNVTREVLAYVEQSNGAIDFPVILRIVNSEVLGGTAPELQLEYVCKQIKYDTTWVSFTLAGSQHITRRTPERRFMKDFCPYAYGLIECGVSAATLAAFSTCKKTLAQCRERGNSKRFGGEPGIPTGGFYVRV
jgi:phage-related protein